MVARAWRRLCGTGRVRPWAAVLALGSAALVLVLTGCAGPRERALPADRGAPVVYVALGDSTVEGIGASRADRNYVSLLHERLRAVYPAARLTNLGVAGATSADVVAEQLPRAIPLAPRLVTLSVGPNDVTSSVPPAAYERNVQAILERLERQTPALVVVTLLPDLGVTPRFRGRPQQEAVARRTEALNEILRAQARRRGAVLVDLHGPSREEVPRRPELVAADGYHPSDAGYARWAELMWRGLAPHVVR
jgi:lysophospholipase L1-like esterase